MKAPIHQTRQITLIDTLREEATRSSRRWPTIILIPIRLPPTTVIPTTITVPSTIPTTIPTTVITPLIPLPQLGLRPTLQNIRMPHDNLRLPPLLPRRLIHPPIHDQTPRHSQPSTLLHVIRHVLRIPPPEFEREPIGLLVAGTYVAHLSFQWVILSTDGEGKVENYLAVVEVSRFGGLSYTADECYRVDFGEVFVEGGGKHFEFFE
mmetsp:Transcript_20160/g.37995  ORF Transcript_20160/g.37995 Transcript_20160/m.37995 type:complete len:207 (+) Transcript_20160:1397-2017(+)